MKRLILAMMLALVLLVVPVLAGQKTATLNWSQTLPSPNDLAGWGLWQSSTASGPYTKILDIPYVSEQTNYTTSTVITAPDLAVTTYYFVMDAVDKSGNRSPKSSEVSATIDFQSPGTPMSLTITITSMP